MRSLAVHTCPLWEEPTGQRRIGMDHEPDHPPVVGWVNLHEVEIDGERRLFLLTLDATR